MKTFVILKIGFLSCLLLQTGSSQTVLIDDLFSASSSAFVLSTSPAAPVQSASFTGLSQTLGGTRDVQLSTQGLLGASLVFFPTPGITDGRMAISNDAVTSSVTILTYDQNGFGLGADFSAGTNLTHLSLTVAQQFNPPSILSFTLIDAANISHTENIPFPGDDLPPTELRASLSDFSANGVDLSDIHTIQLAISTGPDSDSSFPRAFLVVPEPSASALLLAAGAFVLMLRKRS